ncbi:NAD(P)/FAD-dependent oxidoreductase [Mycobacteroides abscessus]|uniref:NAD(P)/FAD-dependent oxidoreductase n=1 Tax=Mycobacteroides abscessus TaxID=36809 RepID=UPI0009A8B188|nr:FAD-dependent oxidoreductase [Mycobacteroides abscessus]SKF27703.1 glycine/D-amino acid oxidase, deaminating [Mycobacteroides abscessus subsp. abscessus]SKR35760.1 glycine/D-amino acid oxidase, deaminating [Mycobacteroides abscessus subsp. abscessus]
MTASTAPGSVFVVGAGVAGLTIAHQLQRRGVDVTVLEAGQVGCGASHGNAGWVNPAQTGPLPEPNLIKDGLRNLGAPDSAVQIALRDYPQMLPWLARFLRNCTARRYWLGAAAVAELGKRTFPLLEQLAADGVDFSSAAEGLLVVARKPAALQGFLRALEPLRAAGYEIDGTVLGGGELRDREPALSRHAQAGLYLRQHIQLDPAQFVTALAGHVRRQGVHIREGVRVIGLRAPNGNVEHLVTSEGEYATGSVIIATGASPLGYAAQLPLTSGRGYSFEVDASVPPRQSTLLLDAHVACSPIGERLRICGGMDFGRSAKLTEQRLEAIAAGAKDILEQVDWDSRRGCWTGERPLTPDGLPVVDRLSGYANAWVATGYSMLGMTLAAPAAEALVDYVLSGQRPQVLQAFGADRFRRFRRRTRRRTS